MGKARGGKEKKAANSCLQFGRSFAFGITKLEKIQRSLNKNKNKNIQNDV